MSYILNIAEQGLARWIGKKRLEHNNKTGAEATPYGSRGDEQMDQINAFGAELAFCSLQNIYPDINFVERRDEDCIWNGYRLDVKWTWRPKGRLLAKQKGWDNPPDYFALMVGDWPAYSFAGMIQGFELLRSSRITTKGMTYPCFAAHQWELDK